MTEHPDVILYILFESIRNDWSCDIDKRGRAILDILPYTTFELKEDMIEKVDFMIESWIDNQEDFDGRHWARDGIFCYYTLFEEFLTLDNLNNTKLLKWGKSNDKTDRLESNWGGEEALELYNEWKWKKVNT